MALYNLYAGLTGAFNNVNYRGSQECDTIKDAEDAAHKLAIDIYKSYEGCYGIASWEDCFNNLNTGKFPFPLDFMQRVDESYLAAMEKRIKYYAVLTSQDSQHPS